MPASCRPISRLNGQTGRIWAGWSLATFGGFVKPIFLADPARMVREGWVLLTEYGFLNDIGITIWRVFGGFVLATIIAVPLGIAMGAWKAVEAFFEPFTRTLPERRTGPSM